jgi:predicted Zn-dependent protease
MTQGKYTNPKVPEGISSGHEHPLAEAAKSAAVVFTLFVVVIAACYVVARLAAPLMPFAWEQALADHMSSSIEAGEPANPRTQNYLRKLAARVAAEMDLPDGMVITVHYVEEDTVNAFANLGGHIVVFEGIWRLMENENTVAMLLAHEIAHIKNRDPITGVSGGLLASLAARVLLGDTGSVADLLDAGSLLTGLHFSREQEQQADTDALGAVYRLYGHVGGSTDLFAAIRKLTQGRHETLQFLDTHPYMENRIANLWRLARQNGWTFQGRLVPVTIGHD